MWKDPIVEEVRAAREAYARKFGFDLRRIGADLKKKERTLLAGTKRARPSRRAKAATPRPASKRTTRRRRAA